MVVVRTLLKYPSSQRPAQDRLTLPRPSKSGAAVRLGLVEEMPVEVPCVTSVGSFRDQYGHCCLFLPIRDPWGLLLLPWT